MNSLFNNAQQVYPDSLYYNVQQQTNKKGFSMQPESLFSMALYDFDAMAHQQRIMEVQHAPQPAFYPVDDYKDLSLREILDISDDFLFGDDEPTPLNATQFKPVPMNTPSMPINTMSSANVLSAPLSLPYPKPIMPMMTMSMNSPLPEEYEPKPIVEPVTSCSKRQREVSDDEGEEETTAEDGEDMRFRPYQAGQWSEKFVELCEYRKLMGHCLVPHTYKENLPLARWVKRQRYQYKLMQEGKPSTMTEDRVRELEDIGFVWDSQGAAWGERLDELRLFRNTYFHSNVPSNFAENPQLATWVKCQRRQFKLYSEGKASNMTHQRIQQLENLGFEWELRTYKKARNC